MKVEILLFASLREIADAPTLTIEMTDGSTVQDLRTVLRDRFPSLASSLDRVRVAIDHEFVTDATSIPDDAEVALIPPVSGGRPPAAGEDTDPIQVLLTEQPILTEPWLESTAAPECGAVLTFHGVVRNEHHGRAVDRLDYSAYPEMALARMRSIATEVRSRWPVHRIAMIHRVGSLEIGETSILIVLSLPHRIDGFDALRFAIDTFKEDVPIWKKERFADGEAQWVEGS